jgi:hypothetical protein
VCIYIYIYIYIYNYMYMRMCVYIYIYLYVYTYMYTCVYVSSHTFIYVYIISLCEGNTFEKNPFFFQILIISIVVIDRMFSVVFIPYQYIYYLKI